MQPSIRSDSPRRLPLLIAALALVVAGAAPFACAQVSNASSNSWTRGADMSAPRSQACSAILKDGSVLVTGGLGRSGPVNTAEIYGTGGTFSVTAPMNQARAGAACTTLPDGRVLVTGGDDGNGASAAAEIFNPNTQTWQTTGGLSVAREGHLAVLTAWGAVWIAGGVNAAGMVGALEQYDAASGAFRTVGTLNTARAEFATAWLPRHRIMIAGGTDGSSTLSSVEIYDGVMGAVSAAGSLAQARKDFAAAALPDGTVLIAGGLDINGALLSSTEIFDPAQGVSKAGPNLLAPRAQHVAYGLTNNGAVLIAGGIGNSGVLSSTETYAPWTGAIQPSASMNFSRRGNVSAVLRPGSLFVAGGGNETGPLSGSELFQYVTIGTDKPDYARPDYAPGSPVKISGGGWQPGEAVFVQVTALPLGRRHIEFAGSGVADGAGNVTVAGFQVERRHLGMNLILSASGSRFQAQTALTVKIDPTIDFAFTPASGAAPGSSITVQVTFTGAGGIPTGKIIPCVNNTCSASASSPVGATCNPVGPQPQEYSLIAGGSSSTCTFTINAIPAGDTLIGVEYSGDTNYNFETAGRNNVTYTAQATTTTAMLAPLNPVMAYGSTTPYVAQAATGGLTPTGQVQFRVNGLAYGSPLSLAPAGGNNYNAFFVPSPPLASGSTYAITANFLGDASNAASGSSNSISASITTASTATTENVSANLIVYGQPLTVSGMVTALGGGTPTGTVTVSGIAGCVNVALTISGTYSCTITSPGPSTSGSPFAVAVTYNPSAGTGYLTSNSSSANLGVNSASTQVSAPVITAGSGGSFTFSATATAMAPSTASVNSGTLSFYSINGSGAPTSTCASTGSPLAANMTVNGTGTASAPSIVLAAGTYTICAVYVPASGNFVSSTSPGVNVTSPGSTIATTLQAPTQPFGAVTFGANTTITGTVASTVAGNNAPVPGTLTFFDAGNGNVQIAGPAAVTQIGAANVASASIVVSNLTGGTHQIYTSYTSTNGAFAPPTPNNSANGSVQINRASASFTVSSGAPNAVSAGGGVTIGANVTLIATYTGSLSTPPSGSVNFINANAGNAIVCTATLGSGVATCNSVTTGPGNNLPPGAGSISVSYPGDVNYTLGAVTPLAFNVLTKAATTTLLVLTPNPAPAGQTVTLTATVSSAAASLKPTGTYTFGLNGTVSNSTCGAAIGVNATTGVAMCTFEILSAANTSYTYTAAYSGDTSFLASSGTASLATLKANPGTPIVTLSPAPLVSGQPLSITAVVPAAGSPTLLPAPTGTVTFTGNGVNVSLPLVNGAVTLSTGASLPALPTGTYNITATYNGDGTYLTAANSVAFTIGKANTTTTPASVNNAMTVTVLPVTPATGTPTGMVTIYSGTAATGAPVATGSLSNGAFTATLAAAQYLAVYSGDQNFFGSTSATSAAANRQPITSTVTLTSSASLVSANQPVVLTALVIGSGATNAPTGTVIFTDNGIAIGTVTVLGGLAGITTTFTGGSHTIVATYSGDTVYPSSSATYGLTVFKPAPTITFSSNLSVAVFGQPVTLTASIAGQGGMAAPTGTVQFFDGAVLLGTATVVNGVATLTVSNLPPGVNNLSAVYSGDVNYASLTAKGLAVTVAKAQVVPTLTADTNNGQETLTVTVAVVAPGSGTPTGTVEFIDTVTGNVAGTAILAGGRASIAIPVTTDPIVAVYSGDGNFNAGTSASVAAIAAVNAASYQMGFAADEIVTVFGTALTTQTISATALPLPITLGGISATVTDSAGTPWQAGLFYVSPTQISFPIPAGVATGTATITVTSANAAFTDTITVTNAAPGLFAANANGSGSLAAQVVSVTPGGDQAYTNTAGLGGQIFVNQPISLTPAASSFYLLLYGTGIRHGAVVTVTINGTTYTPTYSGSQEIFAGLDQINVLLPASLAGSGSVVVSITVDGRVSNAGTISFQ